MYGLFGLLTRVPDKVYGLPTVYLRYFNAYGPNQDPKSQYAAAIPKFISSIIKNKPPINFGDGEQSRDFTSIRDVTEANILVAESDTSGIFNIGRVERFSVNQLTDLIIKLIGCGVKPIYNDSRVGDVRHSLADISKAKEFGYQPKYSLMAGLKETIGWLLQ